MHSYLHVQTVNCSFEVSVLQVAVLLNCWGDSYCVLYYLHLNWCCSQCLLYCIYPSVYQCTLYPCFHPSRIHPSSHPVYHPNSLSLYSAFIYQPSVTPPRIQINMWLQVQVFFFQCFHVMFTWIAFWPSQWKWQAWLRASFWSKMHFLFNVICTFQHSAPSMLVPMATNFSVGTNAF